MGNQSKEIENIDEMNAYCHVVDLVCCHSNTFVLEGERYNIGPK